MNEDDELFPSPDDVTDDLDTHERDLYDLTGGGAADYHHMDDQEFYGGDVQNDHDIPIDRRDEFKKRRISFREWGVGVVVLRIPSLIIP